MSVHVVFLIASHISVPHRLEMLERAITSCRNQTIPDTVTAKVYLSISADASIDRVPTRILELPDKTFIRANHQCAQFVHLTMLTATLLLDECWPDWIVLLDDDDWLEPTYLSAMLTMTGPYRHCHRVLWDGGRAVPEDNVVGLLDHDHSGRMMTFTLFCHGIRQLAMREDPTHGMADLSFCEYIGPYTTHPDALLNKTVNRDDKAWSRLIYSSNSNQLNIMRFM